MVVMIPPMTILPLVLTEELYNYRAKNARGSVWTPSSIQGTKYN